MTQSSTRTLEEINKAYSEAATMAGDIQYKIELLKANLRKVNEQMLAINKEAEVAAQPAPAPQAGTEVANG